MMLTIDVIAGPGTGQQLQLRNGQTAHVGRADWTQLRLPAESKLAGSQFAIECEPQGCTLKAETWDQPILLNGRNILGVTQSQRHPLQHGDEITVGANKFRVSIGSASNVAAAATKPSTVANGSSLVKILDAARPLFALVDAARQPAIPEWLAETNLKCESLYDGHKAMELSLVSPYLVEMPSGDPALQELADTGWGNSWGVYLHCAAPFAETRQHLRRFLTVESGGQRMLFRFYDPRVLRAFLPACNADERSQFFGPIAEFLMEDEDPTVLLRFSASDGAEPRRTKLQPV